MPINNCQLRRQVRELQVHAEELLAGHLPLTDAELTYLVNVVDFADEFLVQVDWPATGWLEKVSGLRLLSNSTSSDSVKTARTMSSFPDTTTQICRWTEHSNPWSASPLALKD